MPINPRDESKNQQSGSEGRGQIKQYLRFWTPESTVCRVANGIPNRVDRLKGLGNATVPQIAEYIGGLLIDSSAVAERS